MTPTKERLDKIERDIRDLQLFCNKMSDAMQSLVVQINDNIDSMNKWRRSVIDIINMHGRS